MLYTSPFPSLAKVTDFADTCQLAVSLLNWWSFSDPQLSISTAHAKPNHNRVSLGG